MPWYLMLLLILGVLIFGGCGSCGLILTVMNLSSSVRDPATVFYIGAAVIFLPLAGLAISALIKENKRNRE